MICFFGIELYLLLCATASLFRIFFLSGDLCVWQYHGPLNKNINKIHHYDLTGTLLKLRTSALKEWVLQDCSASLLYSVRNSSIFQGYLRNRDDSSDVLQFGAPSVSDQSHRSRHFCKWQAIQLLDSIAAVWARTPFCLTVVVRLVTGGICSY